MSEPRSPSCCARRLALLAALAGLALAPAAARAELHLLDGTLRGPEARPVALALLADEARAPDLRTPAPATGPAPSLDFDLLAPPEPEGTPVNAADLRLRRNLLQWHQGVGIALATLTVATTVVGQLNYSDRFAGGPSTGKYELTHAALAWSTVSLYAVNAGLALFAPAPAVPREGFDRITLHKVAMFTGGALMLAQGALGYYTSQREGYLNQERYARAHLVLGYATLAVVAVGVGALVF